MADFDVVVVAGGGGRRLGGVDKGALVVGGRSLLDGVLLATAGARATVVVGDPRPTVRAVTWARETPPGGGPLAALAAGLEHLTAPLPTDHLPTGHLSIRPGVTDPRPGRPPSFVVVLATDLPHLTAADVARLISEAGDADGAVFSDAEGRWQPLAGAYRAEALRRVVRELEPVAGRPVRLLFDRLDLVPVPDHGAAADCDTPDQLAAARERHGRQD